MQELLIIGIEGTAPSGETDNADAVVLFVALVESVGVRSECQ